MYNPLRDLAHASFGFNERTILFSFFNWKKNHMWSRVLFASLKLFEKGYYICHVDLT